MLCQQHSHTKELEVFRANSVTHNTITEKRSKEKKASEKLEIMRTVGRKPFVKAQAEKCSALKKSIERFIRFGCEVKKQESKSIKGRESSRFYVLDLFRFSEVFGRNKSDGKVELILF